MNSHPKLGAFDHASFIFKKKKKEIFIKKNYLKKKKKKKKQTNKQTNKDFKISKSHAFIPKLGAFGSASFK